jgi:hypothetical protein
MEKILLRRLELLQNKDWTKEETLKNILELIDDYSKMFVIFADNDENKYTTDLDYLHKKFVDYYNKNTDINGNRK